MIAASFPKLPAMKKETYLHIPEPCHEQWDKMSPAQQGRFCQQCSKTVVDFSTMTDQQVLKVLSKESGTTCGRFTSDQLERPFVKESTPLLQSPYRLFLSAFIPAFFSTGIANAQMTVGKLVAVKKPVCSSIVKGEVRSDASKLLIAGKVTDNSKVDLAGASISIKGKKEIVSTNAKGEFEIPFPAGEDKITLVVNYVGMESKEVKVKRGNCTNLDISLSQIKIGEVVVGLIELYDNLEDNRPVPQNLKSEVVIVLINEVGEPVPYANVIIDSNVNLEADSEGILSFEIKRGSKKVNLQASSVGYEPIKTDVFIHNDFTEPFFITMKPNAKLEDVIVVSAGIVRCRLFMGSMSRITSVNRIDTVKTMVQKFFKNEMFKVFPNPAESGSEVHLTFKNAGLYNILLFDNNGKLYLAKELEVAADKLPILLPLPSSLAAGTYFIKATNNQTKKQFIDKLIIK